MDDLDALTDQEKEEKIIAVRALLSTKVPRAVIKEGRARASDRLKRKEKTKYDYMKEKKRDFRIMKHKDKQIEETYDLIESTGKVSYAAFGAAIDNPYIRDYNHSVFKETLREIHPKLSTFQNIKMIDLSGQRIGFEQIQLLLPKMDRCPLEVLGLADNLINDDCMDLISKRLRSFNGLRELYLNNNIFSDRGVACILGDTTYPPELETINLARNSLGSTTAYYLGMMFSPQHRTSNLNHLILGGLVGRRSLGGAFLRILTGFLSQPGARSLKKITFADASLEQHHIATLALLMLCCSELTQMNISRNDLSGILYHDLLVPSIRLNNTIQIVDIYQTGTSRFEQNKIHLAIKDPRDLTWFELSKLSNAMASESFQCRLIQNSVKLQVFNKSSERFFYWQEILPEKISDIEEKIILSEPDEDDPTYRRKLYFVLDTSGIILLKSKIVKYLEDVPKSIINEVSILCRNLLRSLYVIYLIYDIPKEEIPENIHENIDFNKLLRRLISSKDVLSRSLEYGMLELEKLSSFCRVRKRKAKSRMKGFGNKLDCMLMAFQECQQQLIEYHAKVEELLGFIYKEMRNLKSEEALLQNNKTQARNYIAYSVLGLSAYYSHYRYHILPFDEAREAQRRLEAINAKALEDKLRLKDAKKTIKNRGIVGQRFAIAEGAGIAKRIALEKLKAKLDLEDSLKAPIKTVFIWANEKQGIGQKKKKKKKLGMDDLIGVEEEEVDDSPSKAAKKTIKSTLYKPNDLLLRNYHGALPPTAMLHGREHRHYLLRLSGSNEENVRLEFEEERGYDPIPISQSSLMRCRVRLECKLDQEIVLRKTERAKALRKKF